MIDTHCHLQTEQFDADREEVLSKAMASGVTDFIVPAIDKNSFAGTLDIASRHHNIFCGLGIHPHSASEWNEEIRNTISAELKANRKIVAIGEIGLDYYYDFCPKPQQIKAFREQIELAKESQKPVIIHTRDSIDETLDIIAEYYNENESTPLCGQFHCFSGNAEQMERAVSLGFYVSYTGNITFKNTKLTDVVLRTPEDRILIETDSPYLAPVPNRGKRNSPEYLGLIAKKIAEIKQKDIRDIMSSTTQNAKRLFWGIAAMLFLLLFFQPNRSYAQVGGKPPDSVMTKERRESEEIIKKQRDELIRAQEERRQDSIRTAQREQEEAIRAAQEQARKDSVRAVEKLAEEAREREKLKTPIAWKAIGVGVGGGVGNLSDVNQVNRSALAPTSVFAYSFSAGTAITRGIDFNISFNTFQFGDNFKENFFKSDINATPQQLQLPPYPKHYLQPTHEDLRTSYWSFDFRFVVNPRSPVKFYLGLGYLNLTNTNTQTYHAVDSVAGSVVNSADSTFKDSYSRGGIKVLFGARYDLEVGKNFILTPFVEIGSGFLFKGTNQRNGFDFYVFSDPIVFTHLNIGATMYFGWFGVSRR